MKITRLEKTLITLCLALMVGLVGSFARPTEIEYIPSCERPAEKIAFAPFSKGDTTLVWLRNLYPILNETYFDDKLPKDVKIDLNETNSNSMATTDCKSNNVNCTIHFNYKYIIAPRHAELVMLHEMCHVPTSEERSPGEGQAVFHGPQWRLCMLKLDIQGAFRYILIDGYNPIERPSSVFK